MKYRFNKNHLLFIFFIFSITAYFGFKIFEPFLLTITLAIILVVITYPFYQLMLKFVKNKNALAAALSCLAVIIVVVIPLFFLTLIIADQARVSYETISKNLQSGNLDSYLNPENWGILKDFIKKNAPFIDVDSINLKAEITGAFRTVSSFLVNNTAKLVSNMGSLISGFFLLIFTMFFFYKDGKKILDTVTHLSPLPSSYERRVYQKFTDVSQSIFVGVFLTALMQGVLDGIAFAIVGISPFLWGIFAAFSSIIPVVGTAVIWLPAGLFLLITGHTGSGIFLMVWCLIVSLLVENLIKPILIKGKTNIHPLLIFFSVLGGIQFFGLIGLVLGPLFISILLLFLEIYEEQNQATLNEMDKS